MAQGLLAPERFKFFFNQFEWVPGALEREVSQGIWTPGRARERERKRETEVWGYLDPRHYIDILCYILYDLMYVCMYVCVCIINFKKTWE